MDPSSLLLKRKFLHEHDEFEVPENQRISVMHVMFRHDALCFFTENVGHITKNIDEVFEKLCSLFMTPAHMDEHFTK